jgi:hypothetical protein
LAKRSQEIPAWQKIKRRRDKVIICGFAPSYKLAPFGDESFDVYGLNELYAFIPRYDRWFDQHTLDVIKKSTRDGKRLESLAKMKCPVYMLEAIPEVPNSVTYPLVEMTREFFDSDDPHEGYWTNSVSYMLAIAIHDAYQEIHVYGVDMASDTEYGHQRPSCEYMLGVARGRGIKVYLPKTADLLKAQFLYGYEDAQKERWRAKMKEKIAHWRGMEQQARAKADEQRLAAEQFSGAIQGAQDTIKLFGQ